MEKEYRSNSSPQHVAGVAGVAAPWPPPWLAALAPPPEAPAGPQAAGQPLTGQRGWRLPSGVVVCRHCCPRPADAVPVVLEDRSGDLQWVEEPAAEAENYAAECATSTHPTATPRQPAIISPPADHASSEPQWL